MQSIVITARAAYLSRGRFLSRLPMSIIFGCIAGITKSIKTLFVGAILILAVGMQAQEVPRYKFDPSWPKELPKNWILGHVEGITVDKDNHIWVLHDPSSVPADDSNASQVPPTAECCVAAPPVLEFDEDGNLLAAWGGQAAASDWPAMAHGLWVDKTGSVWIAGAWDAEFNLPAWQKPKDSQLWDRHVLKFTSGGKLLLEIGRPSKAPINNQDTTILGGPSSMQVDENAHEVYIADGYLNKRIVVYDSDTGKFKRGWGPYGVSLTEINNSKQASYDRSAPSFDPEAPPSRDFRGPLVSLRMSVEGLLYVSDRTNNRIQVFEKTGKFVKEFFVARKTLGEGAPWALAFSHDPRQRFLFVGDGMTNLIWILERSDGSVVSTVGHKGHNGGQFDKIDGIALDSKGNMYVGEVHYNNRIQKFSLVNK
jgi:hypothetical protein